MKLQTRLINRLTIGFLALLCGGIGLAIGSSMVGEYNPPWNHSLLPSVPHGIIAIAHVEFNSTLFDPAGDVIYVANNHGEIYSSTIFQDQWLAVDPVPAWDNKPISKCASEWLGEHDYSHMGDLPPVQKKVIDSAGVRFERPVSTIVRCYVLLDDGSIEIWTHSGNATDLMAGEFMKGVYGVLGMILGFFIGLIVNRFRKRQRVLQD